MVDRGVLGRVRFSQNQSGQMTELYRCPSGNFANVMVHIAGATVSADVGLFLSQSESGIALSQSQITSIVRMGHSASGKKAYYQRRGIILGSQDAIHVRASLVSQNIFVTCFGFEEFDDG